MYATTNQIRIAVLPNDCDVLIRELFEKCKDLSQNKKITFEVFRESVWDSIVKILVSPEKDRITVQSISKFLRKFSVQD